MTYVEWLSAETRPTGTVGAYLVRSESGIVAAWVNGVIQNAVGTEQAWRYGEKVTHWMPYPSGELPPEPKTQSPA